MTKACALLSAVLLAGGLSTAALAHDEGRAGEPMMKGTISSIDHASGKIELKTDQGPAQVYFAPEEIKNFKEGDQVVLELETSKKEAKEMHHMHKRTSSSNTHKES
jgi:hypothetical protein